MGNQGLKQHVENSKKTGVFRLSDAGLQELPAELLAAGPNLRTLDLSGNRLARLPAQVASFGQLKHLTLSRNRLAALADELAGAVKLETLLLDRNRLRAVPASFARLANLKTVNLSDNELATFPLEFCGLKHLDLLDLSRNKIAEVPDGVATLQVVELNLNQNQVSHLSPQMAQCPRLKTLRLEENCLSLAAVAPALLRDSTVSLLALDGNLFDLKDLAHTDGYGHYMQRYTATKKKLY